MALEEIKDHITQADQRARSYLYKSSDYYQLKGFKFLMKGITSFSKMFLVSAIGLIAALFISLAVSFGIGQALNNTFYGFMWVGAFYTVLTFIAFVLRDKLDRPLIKKFSEFYFDES